ncbi:hypothetical protein DPMN_046027 [Dreissena polymorpha]|uniref:Uncharacterized protein n=1 Tax=Dreissena polymorpha TaxID=45954 RepID=A0A9D4HXV2_DREPO|nr:hypothetical protein DPMN_046027 [Dreissena polymorpha]
MGSGRAEVREGRAEVREGRAEVREGRAGSLKFRPSRSTFAYLRTNILVNSHETNVLNKFHENWAKNVTITVFTCFHYIHIENDAPSTGGHVFSPIPTIFKLVRDINKTNVFTNFHDDWAKIVTSRVFTRENCHYIHIEKNAPPTGGHVFFTDLDHFRTLFTRKTAPPTGGHVFQRIGTTFELNQDIIKTNILKNDLFHEDGTRNQILTDGRTYDGKRPVTKAHLSNQSCVHVNVADTSYQHERNYGMDIHSHCFNPYSLKHF